MSCAFSIEGIRSLDPLGLAQLLESRLAWRYPLCTDAELKHLSMPEMRRQTFEEPLPDFTVFTHTRSDGSLNNDKAVLFFIEDVRFNNILAEPWSYFDWLSQYPAVATPDVSVNTDAPLVEQFLAVYQNRLIGAIWQKMGLKVIPTVSWAGLDSYPFCFRGIERGSIVTVSSLGIKATRHTQEFVQGFTAMIEQVKPSVVVCYDGLLLGMKCPVPVITVEHVARQASKAARQLQLPGQQKMRLPGIP